MAKTKPGKRDLDSYTIKGTNKIVKVGDCVLMRPSDSEKPPYVARVEKIEADHRNNVRVRVRWYYRPRSRSGRRQFQAPRSSSCRTTTTCRARTPSRASARSTPSRTTPSSRTSGPRTTSAASSTRPPPADSLLIGSRYCKCEMPYNPDDLMVQCEGCKDWFHPSCMGMTIEEAKKLDHFLLSRKDGRDSYDTNRACEEIHYLCQGSSSMLSR
ncbi:Lysine-specific demethylase PHF2 [Ananas comosus]|uniref:Lysine-specific demethylase PHF2 n=1 Tax=Ananas comosus TaxID=4615 RepID=A0A199VQJ2_ANACO|nr:Lysine-specific demethylase PHF2 [Ananas comosus]